MLTVASIPVGLIVDDQVYCAFCARTVLDRTWWLPDLFGEWMAHVTWRLHVQTFAHRINRGLAAQALLSTTCAPDTDSRLLPLPPEANATGGGRQVDSSDGSGTIISRQFVSDVVPAADGNDLRGCDC
jgi:hypothetical protein